MPVSLRASYRSSISALRAARRAASTLVKRRASSIGGIVLLCALSRIKRRPLQFTRRASLLATWLPRRMGDDNERGVNVVAWRGDDVGYLDVVDKHSCASPPDQR